MGGNVGDGALLWIRLKSLNNWLNELSRDFVLWFQEDGSQVILSSTAIGYV